MVLSQVTSHEMFFSSQSLRGGRASIRRQGRSPSFSSDGSGERTNTLHYLITIHGEELTVFHHEAAMDDAVADIGAAGSVD